MRSILFQIAIICLLAAAGLSAQLFWPTREKRSQPTLGGEPPLRDHEVRMADVATWKNILWLDARERDRYDQRHIPGALLLNEDEWDALLPDVLSAPDLDTRPMIVYCDSSCGRSYEVATRLRRETGLDKIYALRGGIEAWTAAQPK